MDISWDDTWPADGMHRLKELGYNLRSMNENVKKSRYISGRSRSITLFENIHECRYGEIMHIASIKAWGLCGKKKFNVVMVVR